MSCPASTTRPLWPSARAAPAGGSSRRRPGDELGLKGQHLHGPAGPDQGPGELVGGLGHRAHGQDQERGVAVEGDQLAHADLPGHGQPGPQPGDRDHEDARERDLGRVQQRLHLGRGQPGRPHLLGGGRVAAGEHRLAADAAQHPQPADGVGPDGGQLADQLPVPGPAPVQRAQQRPDPGRQQRHPGHDQQPKGGRGAQQQRGHDHEGDQRPGQPGHDVHGRADPLGVMGADGGDLAGRDPARQRAAEPHRLADQQLLDPVGGGQPVDHGGAVAKDPGDGGDQPGRHDQGRPADQRGPVALGHALVDGPPDQGRHDRQGAHPDHAVEDPDRERAKLPARHPQQKAGGRAQVGRAGMTQRELAHPPTVPAAPAAENRITSAQRHEAGHTARPRGGWCQQALMASRSSIRSTVPSETDRV